VGDQVLLAPNEGGCCAVGLDLRAQLSST